MELLRNYLIENFILLCIAVVLIVTAIRKLKAQKRISIYLILIISATILISIFNSLQVYAEKVLISVKLTTFLAASLYVIRPGVIILFIYLSSEKSKGIWNLVLLLPLFYCIIVNIFPFIKATEQFAFFYDIGEDGFVGWHPGKYRFFRYTSHIVSIIYLVYLTAHSVFLLKRKHWIDAISVLVCAFVVTLATVIETFFNEDGSINLLTTAIAISTVFYYMFLYERQNKLDALTGLFTRASYYDDIAKVKNDVTSVIQLDMNGLKYINDNYGHLEGDKAIKFVTNAISENCTGRMYPYRLGGDEFVVLSIGEKEEKVSTFVLSLKNAINKEKYYCSVGVAHRREVSTFDELFKLSESRMYQDKSEFYANSGIERRKQQIISEDKN